VSKAGFPEQQELVTRFIAGHEKGHHLQELLSPHRLYEVDHHVMEIEADLIGAWSLALQNVTIAGTSSLQAVKLFDDANRIAQKLGKQIGDPTARRPHHPWAEQRELALVKGPAWALSYPTIADPNTRLAFAR
jgi:hypothetical protein